MQLDWDNVKNSQLRTDRKISFEDIVVAIDAGGLVDLIEHPNQSKYPHQKMMLIHWGDYIYMVPCVKTQEGYFLKTIIPSRKATRGYLGERKEI